ncbi:hypothetical protein AURDEDRAFT_168024 [Auricularia subglabra TFB-10046 SS5]|nr:hypothetical protein AURDEDRAFT_168024 [Auricularia subglabra TFB-10046 SS5]
MGRAPKKQKLGDENKPAGAAAAAGGKSGKNHKSKGPTKKDKKQGTTPAQKPVYKAIAVQWQTKGFEHLTDALLTEIEEDDTIRCALGFDAQGAPKTKGVTQIEMNRKIARKVLLVLDEYKDMDPEKAADAVKNRVARHVFVLKRDFTSNKTLLKDTGEGLLVFDDDGLVTGDEDVRNLYEKVLGDFPWYRRMRNLMGGSPAYDRSALANSQTPIDFSGTLLRQDTKTPRKAAGTPSSASVKRKRDDGSSDDCSASSDSGSDFDDSDDEPEDVTADMKAHAAADSDDKPPVKAELSPTKASSVQPVSRKPRTPLETLSANLAEDRAARQKTMEALVKHRDDKTSAALQIAEMRLEGEKAKLEAKERQQRLDLEAQERRANAEIAARERQQAADRAFQLELARLKMGLPQNPGNVAQPVFPPAPQHAFDFEFDVDPSIHLPAQPAPPPPILELLKDIPNPNHPFAS